MHILEEHLAKHKHLHEPLAPLPLTTVVLEALPALPTPPTNPPTGASCSTRCRVCSLPLPSGGGLGPGRCLDSDLPVIGLRLLPTLCAMRR